MASHAVLKIPGWDVVDDDGLFIATRHGKLTEYQRLAGAVSEVTARGQDELWILCDAHTRFAERLATAESIRPKVNPYQPLRT